MAKTVSSADAEERLSELVDQVAHAGGGQATDARGIAAFAGLAFGLSWSAWAIGLRATGARGASLLGSRGQAAVLPGSFGPALAACVVRRWVTREGFGDAGLAPNLRRGWRRYAVALAVPCAAAASTVGLASALGLGRPDFTLARAREVLALGGDGGESGGLGALLVGAAVSSLVNVPLVWGEEYGWRGYLQPRLLPDSPALAAVATGLVWGVWHYPLVLAGYGLFAEGRVREGLLLYPLLCVPLSVFLGWLRRGTGSVWAPCLGHAAHNSVAGTVVLMLFAGGPNTGRVAMLLAIPYVVSSPWMLRAERRTGSPCGCVSRCDPSASRPAYRELAGVRGLFP